MEKSPESFRNPKKKQLNDYARYTGIAIQMLIIILGGVYGGYALDGFFKVKFPFFTLTLCLVAVFLAMYVIIKQFGQKKQ
jgi:hypothetical protein